MRFIKPCQFAVASQRYRFCSWSGLVPPRHRKTSFRILKSLLARGTQSVWRPWERGCWLPQSWLLGTREEEAAGHTTLSCGFWDADQHKAQKG